MGVGGEFEPIRETKAPLAASLHCFPVGVPGLGSFGPAAGAGAGPGEIRSGRQASPGGARKVSIFPPAAVFIDSL